MNIILFNENEIPSLSQPQICLVDHRAKHIVKVLRSEVGDELKVGVINGGQGKAKVLEITPKYPFSVRLEINHLSAEPEPLPPIDLILALPRPIMLRRILSQATTLGIGNLFLINANRVEKSFWQASLLEEQEYQEHLRIGLEQAVATRLPKVHIYDKFKPFVEDILPPLLNSYTHKVVADPRGDRTLKESLLGTSHEGSYAKTLLAIGPEGGWVDYELTKFSSQGFHLCTIGSRILKVDTAVIALHSRISALLETEQF